MAGLPGHGCGPPPQLRRGTTARQRLDDADGDGVAANTLDPVGVTVDGDDAAAVLSLLGAAVDGEVDGATASALLFDDAVGADELVTVDVNAAGVGVGLPL